MLLNNKVLKVRIGKPIFPAAFSELPSNTAVLPLGMLKPAALYGNFQIPYPFIENLFIPTAAIWLNVFQHTMIVSHFTAYQHAMPLFKRRTSVKTTHLQ